MNTFINSRAILPYPGTLLRIGSTGSNVRIIQEYLNTIGTIFPNITPLVVDGIFGPRTEASVIAFQRQFSLTPDGIVGPITWAEIMRQHAIVMSPPPSPSGFFNYTVVAGDTLWRLAQRFGTTVDAIRALNGLTGDVLNIGQVLRSENSAGTTPPPPSFPYTVVAGDSLWALAQRFGVTVDAIRSLNNLAGDMIYIGQILYIPNNTTPPLAPKTIVIDAGHGGSDVGATLGTRLEKNDNLRLALAVQRILQEQGQKVIMTRSTDVSVPLAERSAISNRNNADLFVSIHRNASTNPAANGVENYVFTDASNTEVLYAQNVLSEIVRAGVQNNGGVIRANFAVLRNTLAPAMLIELGFITNQRDNQLFDQNFDAYAAAIAHGIMESLRGSSLPPPSYFFYTIASGDSLWSVAQRFGTTVNAIIALNGFTNDRTVLGQVIKIPSRS